MIYAQETNGWSGFYDTTQFTNSTFHVFKETPSSGYYQCFVGVPKLKAICKITNQDIHKEEHQRRYRRRGDAL